MLPRARTWLRLGLLLVVAHCVGCERESDGGTARFAAAFAAPCPLFGSSLFDPARPPVACPWPAVGAKADALPCAIEYHVGDDPKPRVTRRLAYDADGRLRHFSDHRDGKTVESRRITYGSQTRELVVHDYADTCGAPAPQHLVSQTFGFDETWRLTRWRSGERKAAIRYTYTPGIFSADATAHVAGLGKPGWARFDVHGHVLERGTGNDASTDQRTHSVTLDHEGSRVTSFAHVDQQNQRGQRGAYAYADGRPVSLTLESPGRSVQRYVFRYGCDAVPQCAPATLAAGRRAATHATALDLDPQLKGFVARDCSDHFEHSGNTCGTLLRFGAGFSASCCTTSADEIQVRSDSPFTRGHVDAMRIEEPGGRQTLSTYCAKAEDLPQPPWACRFRRADLLSLKGRGTLRVLGRGEQTIMKDEIDLEQLGRVAR